MSVDSAGIQGNGLSERPSISLDGYEKTGLDYRKVINQESSA